VESGGWAAPAWSAVDASPAEDRSPLGRHPDANRHGSRPHPMACLTPLGTAGYWSAAAMSSWALAT
jgi:hypothetical protein